MWIIGSGWIGGVDGNSTEIVDDTGSIEGPTLPLHIGGGCATTMNSTHVIITGVGERFSDYKSTLIVDHNDNWKMTVGPKLRKSRSYHTCSKLQHPNGKNYIVVAGGHYSPKSVELIDIGCTYLGEDRGSYGK